MGQSTDGILLFGVVFEEGFEFPWDDHDDIEDWWREVSGFRPTFSPYTPEGEYAEGVKSGDPRIDAYYSERRQWDAAHPLPVELVNVCSGDYPIYALAVLGTVTRARRGYPEPITRQLGDVFPEPLVEFCEAHGIEMPGDAGWLLASYWG